MWLVGESNPYSENPRLALYPRPDNSAGGRLCLRVLGLERREYLARFERRNLLPEGRWSAPAARDAADRILVESDGAPLALLGRRVADAFALEYMPFVTWRRGGRALLMLPHPSGRCRVWNDPSMYSRARACVRALELG